MTQQTLLCSLGLDGGRSGTPSQDGATAFPSASCAYSWVPVGQDGALVGEKLWQLACYHQVICITHLPQLAALYDSHFHVRKQISEDRTRTIVDRLGAEDSMHELASLMGADNEENITAVRVMLKESEKFKSEKTKEG